MGLTWACVDGWSILAVHDKPDVGHGEEREREREREGERKTMTRPLVLPPVHSIYRSALSAHFVYKYRCINVYIMVVRGCS